MGWKIFSWFYAIPVLLFTLNLNRLNSAQAVFVLISWIEVAGLFSYAYKRKILSRVFWKIFLIIEIAKQVTAISMIFANVAVINTQDIQNLAYIITFTLTYCLIGFCIMFALFRYSFRFFNT